jgi:ABC-type glycerol-3-phosphate transport system permease component
MVTLSAVTAVLLFPLLLTLLTSLKPAEEIITTAPALFPRHWTLDNYRTLYALRDFPRYLWNSLLVASLTAAATTVIAAMAAYALVWMRFPGKRAMGRSVFFTYMFPDILLVIPLFMVCYELALLDTRTALVLTYLSLSLPFGIWLLKSYFESIPVSILEAARLDGCSEFQCLWKVVLPVAMPAVAAVAVLTFVMGWSEYLNANTLITTNANRTIAIGLQTLAGYHRTDYGLLAAAGIVMVAPVVVFFLAVQKYLVEGLAFSTTKRPE